MMKKSSIRWVLIAILLAVLALTVSSPALAEIKPLPLDQTVPGYPAQKDGWSGEQGYNYQDESITVTTEFQKHNKVQCSIVRIKIADPSQIRTAMSENDYDKTAYVKATAMAKNVNAIAAVNGDFFKYYDYGYLIRQGVFYREGYSAKHPRDILVIDDKGDFHAVANATEESMAAFFADEFPKDRTAVNTFSLGPILVKDGVVQEITTRDFQYRYKMQRAAIVQLGELEYAIVECDGKSDASYGMTIANFAEYIKELFPDCRLAYNLDGGGSTNVIVNGKRIHKNPDARKICDILYFASAYTEE